MSPVANRLRAYLPPQAVQPSGSIAPCSAPFLCNVHTAATQIRQDSLLLPLNQAAVFLQRYRNF